MIININFKYCDNFWFEIFLKFIDSKLWGTKSLPKWAYANNIKSHTVHRNYFHIFVNEKILFIIWSLVGEWVDLNIQRKS